MGNVIVGAVLLLAVWNAVRTLGRQKKRMRDARCTGDCASCRTPCQAQRIYRKEK